MATCMGMRKHLNAFVDPERVVQIGEFLCIGPSERILGIALGIATRDMWIGLVQKQLVVWHAFFHLPAFVAPTIQNLIVVGSVIFGLFSIVNMLYTSFRYYRAQKQYSTIFGIVVCFLLQGIKIFQSHSLTSTYAIMNGIALSTLTCDLILGKMAKRQLHPLIPTMHLAGVAFPEVAVPVSVFYYFIVLWDVSSHYKLSILNPVRNVLVTGYYDGCHEGHVRSLQYASRFGTKLTAGVHSDEDYYNTKFDSSKSNHLMNKLLTRVAAVANVPCVDDVIPSCPRILTPEYLREHNIHAVGMSEEYVYARDPVTDKITDCDYTYAPVMDYLEIIPRTEGISSSLLRMQVRSSYDEFRALESLITDVRRKVRGLLMNNQCLNF